MSTIDFLKAEREKARKVGDRSKADTITDLIGEWLDQEIKRKENG